MSDDAILQGSYAGLRLVKTRRVAVIEVELPIEALRKIIDVLGAPDPASEIPVAVVLLSKDAARAPSPTAEESRPSTSTPASEAARPRTPWHQKSLAQQAGSRCSEPRFVEYLQSILPTHVPLSTKEEVAVAVRRFCGVSSRADIGKVQNSAERWKQLDAGYRRWAGLETEPRG